MVNNNQQTANKLTLIGVFNSPQQTENALLGLRNAGYLPGNITVIKTEAALDREPAGELKAHKTGQGVGMSAIQGGLVGAIFGFLTAAVTFMLGFWAQTGWDFMGAGLTGVILGYAVGAIAGLFYRLSGSEDQANAAATPKSQDQYARVLVNVTNHEKLEEVRTILQRHGAYGTRYYRDPVQFAPFKGQLDG